MKRYKNVGYSLEEDPKGPWLDKIEVLAALESIADDVQYYDSYENPVYEICIRLIQELEQ